MTLIYVYLLIFKQKFDILVQGKLYKDSLIFIWPLKEIPGTWAYAVYRDYICLPVVKMIYIIIAMALCPSTSVVC